MDWNKRCGKCWGCRSPRGGMCSVTLDEADRRGLLLRLDGFDPDRLVRRAGKTHTPEEG